MANYLNESVSMRIEAPPRVCFAEMADFEKYPEWQNAISSAKILRQGNSGPQVEFIADALIKKFRYILQYHLQPDINRMTWDFIEGDIKFVAGYFEALEISPGVSQATYQLNLDPGFWAPAIVITTVKKVVMAGVLKDLQKRISLVYVKP